jgi:hypothetical protein
VNSWSMPRREPTPPVGHLSQEGSTRKGSSSPLERGGSKCRRVLLAAFAISLSTSPATAADWAPQLTAAATWEENVTNANRAGDRVDALQLATSLAVEQRTGLTRELALLYGAQLEAESWPRFDQLDRVAAGPTLALRYKNGLGALAPTFTLSAAGTLSAARDFGRAGPAGSLSLVYAQGLTDTTHLTAGITGTRLDAHESVYARSGLEGFVECAYDFDANWRLRLSARWRHGDVLSYANPPRPDLVGLARDRTDNDAFGPSMIVYSLDAHTVSAGALLSRALDEATSLNLGVEWRETTRTPLLYVNRLVSLGVTRQF